MVLPFPPGKVIDGRFKTVGVLGRGGHGAVYKAVQLSTGQDVAVKVLLTEGSSDPARAKRLRARFQREMQAIGRLKHPNIVRLIDTGVIGKGNLYTVLELVEGETLTEVLANEHSLQVAEAHHLMLQVLDAVSSAHAAGIVHRDLKPSNVMITRTGARRNAMVLDFGIAGIMSHARSKRYEQLTKTGISVGTTAFMAPEQIRGEELTPQIDIYAWGLVLLSCVAGIEAVQRPTQKELLTLHLSAKPFPIPPGVDDGDLCAILAKALGKKLKRRYASAEEALQAFSRYRPPVGVENTLDATIREVRTMAHLPTGEEEPAGAGDTQRVNMLSAMVPDTGELLGDDGDDDEEATVVAPPSMLRDDPFAFVPDATAPSSRDVASKPKARTRSGRDESTDEMRQRINTGERASTEDPEVAEEERRKRARRRAEGRSKNHRKRAPSTKSRSWPMLVGIGVVALLLVVALIVLAVRS